MSARRPFSVAVVSVGNDRSTMLRLVATLHRRGVDVIEAELAPFGVGRRSFAATFLATGAQATTAAASLRNLTDVVGVELRESDDDQKIVSSMDPRREECSPQRFSDERGRSGLVTS